ncbi:MAG: 16S rRNA (guanine(966)-N(2))-methyltransferase RsmD [Desulfocapsaceae bacterium]|jgi:16S rRNA (guanine966-N2)-methyltransferase|nr:16S rRNA (guanine(966)-N(2))-methyltransferase RsmD [Desulfocapsaceae bacterium]
MRIISGLARGSRLFAPPARSRAIRPTSDRAREALFSIIGSRVGNSHVLDLFAGTGALGCEALSRGAHSVTFVDNSRQALLLVQRNSELIPGGGQRSRIIQHDLKRSLPFAGDHSSALHPFDLVFADPPYQQGFTEKILFFLDKSSVLAQKVLIILEEKKGVQIGVKLDNLFLEKNRCYGDSCFHFFMRKPLPTPEDLKIP